MDLGRTRESMGRDLVELIHGQHAHTPLRDPHFLRQWRILHRACPYATAFQEPTFVCAWFETYDLQWQPVIVQARHATGDLVGLWLLAYNPATNVLAHAGTHQAEYHTWLAIPDQAVAFLSAAWNALKRHLPFATLRFKYLPDSTLGRLLQQVPGIRDGLIVRLHPRPLLHLDPEAIKTFFVKRSNKNRFNRL